MAIFNFFGAEKFFWSDKKNASKRKTKKNKNKNKKRTRNSIETLNLSRSIRIVAEAVVVSIRSE